MNYNFKQVFYKIRAKTLLLRAIYEQFVIDESQYRLLLYQVQSFDKLVRRNKEILNLRTIGYIKFVKLLKQISNYKYREYLGKNKSKEILLKKIEQEKEVLKFCWFIYYRFRILFYRYVEEFFFCASSFCFYYFCFSTFPCGSTQ